MLYLILTLLFLGFLQSLFELKKDKTKKSKRIIERILSWIYILVFVVGIILAFSQNQESLTLSQTIDKISLSVSKIDSNSLDQVNKLSKSLQETKDLLIKTDSLNNNIKDVISIRDSLITQTKEINKKLSQQLSIDKQNLKEKEAKMELIDADIFWTGNDSTVQSVQACIRNLGKRNAIINSGSGYFVFFDDNKKPFFSVDFPGNTRKAIVLPYNNRGARYCYNSWSIRGFKILKEKTYFAVMCLKISYRDALFNDEKIEYFYSGWLPNDKSFGGNTDWQINLAKDWAIKNKKLK